MTAPQLILGNPLTAFENGVQLDLRAKLAIEFIKAAGAEVMNHAPRATVQTALLIAEELIEQSDEKGYVVALPEDDGLSAPMRTHLRKNVRAQIYQQMQGQKIQMEEMPQVQQAAAIPQGIPPLKLS